MQGGIIYHLIVSVHAKWIKLLCAGVRFTFVVREVSKRARILLPVIFIPTASTQYLEYLCKGGIRLRDACSIAT